MKFCNRVNVPSQLQQMGNLPCDIVASLSVSSYSVKTVFFCPVSSTYPVPHIISTRISTTQQSQRCTHKPPTKHQLTHSLIATAHSSGVRHQTQHTFFPSLPSPPPLPIHSTLPCPLIHSSTSLASFIANRLSIFLFQNSSLSMASTRDSFQSLWKRQ